MQSNNNLPTLKNSNNNLPTLKQFVAANAKVVDIIKSNKLDLAALIGDESKKALKIVFKPDWASKELDISYSLSTLSIYATTPKSIISGFLEAKPLKVLLLDK